MSFMLRRRGVEIKFRRILRRAARARANSGVGGGGEQCLDRASRPDWRWRTDGRTPYGELIEAWRERAGVRDRAASSDAEKWRPSWGSLAPPDYELGWWYVSIRELFIFLLGRRRSANQLYNTQKIATLETTHQTRIWIIHFKQGPATTRT